MVPVVSNINTPDSALPRYHQISIYESIYYVLSLWVSDVGAHLLPELPAVLVRRGANSCIDEYAMCNENNHKFQTNSARTYETCL